MNLLENTLLSALNVSEESDRMADSYVHNKIIPIKLDAAHIAIVSIHGFGCLVSFNFRYINKMKTKRMVENVNLNEDYKGITICTPMKVLNEELNAM